VKQQAPPGFNPQVPLPKDLTIGHIARAIDYIEKELTELIDIYHEQANVFSGIVGIYGAKALHNFSAVRKAQAPGHCAAALPGFEAQEEQDSSRTATLARIERQQASVGVAVTLRPTPGGISSGGI
jgi:hypothetical protein